MKVGYIRTTPAGPSAEAQRDALAAAGLRVFSATTPLFLDDRDGAISALGGGDVLIVASPGCLGSTASDVLDVLAQIALRGATVLDAASGTVIACPPTVLSALDFAKRAESENKRAITAKARRARAATGRFNQWPGWDEARTQRLKDMVAEGGLSRDEIAAALGTSRATIQRKLREIKATGKGAKP